MLQRDANSGRLHGCAGSFNIADNAGDNREEPASASSPVGASSDSLASRSVSTKIAAESALSMARPPTFSEVASLRISDTRFASGSLDGEFTSDKLLMLVC